MAAEALADALLHALEAEKSDAGTGSLVRGLRQFLHAAADGLAAHTSLDAWLAHTLLRDTLRSHVMSAMRQGHIRDVSVDEALDLILGVALIAAQRLAATEMHRHYPERIVAGILRGLGMSARQAGRWADMPGRSA